MDVTTSLFRQARLPQRAAIRFIVLLGLVSLFGDMTYEGARSIVGPYLAALGASATVVGVAAGFGELVGYAFRLLSGYIGDRTGRYWTVTIIGCVLNLFAVPLLALAGNWQIAVVLIVTERIGRALRAPTRDAMLSQAATRTGAGWAFGLHDDPDVIAATMAAPGVVLKRPVGSSGPFKEHAELPTNLAGDDISKKAGSRSVRSKPQKHPKPAENQAADREAALAFEKEQKRREREREKEEAAQRKERERQQKAVDKAQSALDAARRTHEKSASDIQAQLEALEERSQAEEARWEKEKARLEAALKRARGHG